jgi:cytochrome c oxidase subunit IV
MTVVPLMTTDEQARVPDRRAEWVWLALVGLTLLTYLVGQFGTGGLWISLAVLLVALFKGWLVGDYFMGLHWVRGWWRWVIFVWLFIPGVLIAIAFYRATS